MALSTDPTVRRWRVSRQRPVATGLGAVAFVVTGVLVADDPSRVAVTGAAAVVLAVLCLRDLLVPVRLAADGDGITVVVGAVGRRRVPWSEIEAVRVDVRSRLGLRSETLEVDAGFSIHLFGRHDVDEPLDEVAAALERLRTAAPGLPGTAQSTP